MKIINLIIISSLSICYSQKNNNTVGGRIGKEIMLTPYEEFYKNGKLRISGFMKDSLRDSIWLYYDKKGKLFYKAIYNNGKLKHENYLYHKNGEFNLIINDTI